MMAGSDQPAERNLARGHAAPFLVWVGCIAVLAAAERLFPLPALVQPWVYAVKSAACAALFLWWRPWRIYPAMRLRNALWAVAAGLAVAGLWVLPETVWFGQAFPSAQAFYHRWLILMPGVYPDYYDPARFPLLPPGFAGSIYDPAVCGWGLSLARLVGSALVIAVIEEFFFRGFLYRWLRQEAFWKIPLTRWDLSTFWIVVLVFGIEHDRWLAGMAAGAVYGLLAVRTGDLWAAALAHGLTNLALGAYVLLCGRYGFW
ncbi:MAG: CAAX prenyl protease-related protein [Lentisphaerae bacterium]|nr:CAAX prenyl protease-related protein [Lentisphaerota bacterium]